MYLIYNLHSSYDFRCGNLSIKSFNLFGSVKRHIRCFAKSKPNKAIMLLTIIGKSVQNDSFFLITPLFNCASDIPPDCNWEYICCLSASDLSSKCFMN